MKLYEMIVARNSLVKLYKSGVPLKWGTLAKIKRFIEDTEADAIMFRNKGNEILACFQDKDGKIPREAILVADKRIRDEVGNAERDCEPLFSVNEFSGIKMCGDDFEAILPLIAQSK